MATFLTHIIHDISVWGTFWFCLFDTVSESSPYHTYLSGILICNGNLFHFPGKQELKEQIPALVLNPSQSAGNEFLPPYTSGL